MDIQNWIDEKVSKFEDEFPAMGVCGDPKDQCVYRFDQYVSNKSLLKEYVRSSLTALLAEVEKTIEGFIKSAAAEKCDENHENCTIAGSKIMAYQRVLKLLRPSEPKEWCCTWKSCEKCNNK